MPQFFTPDSTDRTLYARHTDAYTGTQNKKRPVGKSPQYHDYDDAVAEAMKKDAYNQPRNVLDRLWIDNVIIRDDLMRGYGADAWMNRYVHALRVRTYSPQDYFYTLDRTTDPVDYIHMLTLWPLFGVNLAPYLPFGSGPINYSRAIVEEKNGNEILVKKYDPLNLPALNERRLYTGVVIGERGTETRDFYFDYRFKAPSYKDHSFGYAEYVKRMHPILDDVVADFEFDIRERIQMIDEGVLNAKYERTMQMIRRMRSIIEIKNQVVISSESGHVYYRINFGLPSRVNTIGSKTGRNVKSDTPPQAIVPVEIDGSVYAVNQILFIWIENALKHLKGKRDELAAKIEKVSDPKQQIKQTENLKDPAKNIRLVYDPVKSREKGEPVYTDVSFLHAQYDPKDVISPEDFSFSFDEYRRGLQRTKESQRDTYVPGAGYYSQRDIDGLTDDDEGGILPWVIGGVVTAAIAATQFK